MHGDDWWSIYAGQVGGLDTIRSQYASTEIQADNIVATNEYIYANKDIEDTFDDAHGVCHGMRLFSLYKPILCVDSQPVRLQ